MAKQMRIMEQVTNVMRTQHYAFRTERAYKGWIKRYINFHEMQCREDMKEGERKVEEFLTHLAVEGNVSPSTQNQALNALVFLYKKILKAPLGDSIDAVRATKKRKIPVVLTQQETGKVISFMSGVPQLVAKLLYGSGLRMSEAVRLRVKDIEFSMKEIIVRTGKGDKDRVTTLSESAIPFFCVSSSIR